jgi:putative tryptophan/tyrosine transport system substrate-binding protein
MRASRPNLRVTLILALLAAPLATGAQQPGKIHRIGVLETSSSTALAGRVEAFRNGLSERGLTEGQNLHIEWRFADGSELKLPSLAMELLRLKPDVLVSFSSTGIGALQSATTDIPIVMAGSESRSVPQDLRAPSGNTTGVISIARDLESKRIELLREAVPALSHVAVLQDATNWPYRPGETAPSWTDRWGVTFIQIKVRGPDDFQDAMTKATKEGANALSLFNIPLFYIHRRRLAELAVANRLAWIAADREYAEAGCLMSYGPDGRDLARRAATYVDKILKGVKPWNLPLEQPTKIELVINLKTAKALGLTIPPSVLARADEVLQ